jgi:predicted dehydrogenase
MGKKLRLGVIGIGGMCSVAHLPVYEAMDEVEVVAVCDIIKERAETGSKKFGGKPLVFTDYRELIALDSIDAVDICTPNYLHSVIAVDALNVGKHVFCEKPDAVSVDEVLKMQAAAEKSGKTLMIMRNNRFEASSIYLKNYIENGMAGEIYCGRCGWIRRRGIPGKGGWFTTKSMSGGGPLIDLGVHMIDLSIWLMGNPRPVAVSGSTYRKFADNNDISDSEHASFGEKQEDGIFDVEDLAMGFIKFDNGSCLQIEFSWASNIENEAVFVELRGTKSGFSWHNGSVKIFGEEQGYPVDCQPNTSGSMGGHQRNLRHFVDVVLNGTQPVFKPQQGVDMIKILTAIYKSAQDGKEVLLDI